MDKWYFGWVETAAGSLKSLGYKFCIEVNCFNLEGGGGGVLGGLFFSDCFFVASVDLATHCERSFGHLTQGSSLNVSERVVEPDMYDKHSASGVCFCGTK